MRHGWLVVMAGLALASTTSAHLDPPGPSAAVEEALAPGETRGYDVVLRAGDYVRAVVEQRGIDVSVTAVSPLGRVAAAIDSPNDRWGPEPLAWIASETGPYRIEVRAAGPAAPGAVFLLRLEEPRPAAPRDRHAAAAAADLQEATRLIVVGSTESRRAALQRLAAALARLRTIADEEGEARALHLSALAHRQLGEARSALGPGEASLALRVRLVDRAGQAESLNELGLAHFALGDLPAAARRFEQVAALRRELAQEDGVAVALSNLALVAQAGGRLPEALERYEAALASMRTVDHPQQAVTLNNVGGLYHQLGQPEEALAAFEQALPLLRAAGRRHVESDTLNNLARLRLQLGAPQEALGLLRQALDLARATGHRRGETATRSNLGELHARFGAPAAALSYFEGALATARELGDRRHQGILLNQIGRALLETGRPREAQARLAEAAELWPAVGDRRGRAFTLYESADVARALGDPTAALRALEAAQALFREAEDRPGQAAVLDRIGQAHLATGEAARALAAFRASLDMRTEIGDRLGAARTLTGLGVAAAALERLEEAGTHLQSATLALERLRDATLRPDLRTSLLASHREAYERLIDVQMRLHLRAPDGPHAGAALEAHERFRARSLLDALAAVPGAPAGQDLTPVLARRLRGLHARIQAVADTFDPAYRGPRGEAARMRSLDDLLRERDEILAQVREVSPRYAELTQPRAANLAEIRRELLDGHTLLLEYALLPGRSYLWALDSEGLRAFALPGRKEIESAVARVRERWRSPGPGTPGAGAEAELARHLFPPEVSLLGYRRLAIVPGGVLESLPLGALPEAGTGAPLLTRYEVVFLPSASALLALRRDLAARPRAKGLFAVFADPVFDPGDPRVRAAEAHGAAPVGKRSARAADAAGEAAPRFYRLPSTGREAEAILSLDPAGKSLAALGFEATRERATGSDIAGYRFVHFATHGWLDDRRPELSGVVLSLVEPGGAPLDGFLRLHQIVDLRLGADLVVLSACETALGREVHGEGLVGLARGFMHAGAPRVVASLWQVPDLATTELMRRFYRAMLLEGATPASALRTAQLGVRAQPRWRHPYYWAGFVLQGEWR